MIITDKFRDHNKYQNYTNW